MGRKDEEREERQKKRKENWGKDHHFLSDLNAAGVLSWPALYTSVEIATVLSFRKCSGM